MGHNSKCKHPLTVFWLSWIICTETVQALLYKVQLSLFLSFSPSFLSHSSSSHRHDRWLSAERSLLFSFPQTPARPCLLKMRFFVCHPDVSSATYLQAHISGAFAWVEAGFVSGDGIIAPDYDTHACDNCDCIMCKTIQTCTTGTCFAKTITSVFIEVGSCNKSVNVSQSGLGHMLWRPCTIQRTNTETTHTFKKKKEARKSLWRLRKPAPWRNTWRRSFQPNGQKNDARACFLSRWVEGWSRGLGVYF